MRFDFSRFLRLIESRARTRRGLSLGATGFAALSAVSVAAMLAVRLLRLPLPLWAVPTFAVPPLLGAVAGYGHGRTDRPRMPHILLQIDDALGLNARLSSLYELRQRGEASIFRQRIEAEVSEATGEWRTALPIGRRTVLGASAGVCCLALAVGLAFVPLPDVAGSPLDMADQAATLQDPVSDAADSLVPPPRDIAAPVTVRMDGAGEPEGAGLALDAPERDEMLEDVMRDLSWMTPDQAVLVPVSPEEIEELARLQGDAMRAIADLLERIRDRLENSPPAELTDEERKALERELDRGSLPPEIQEGLSELLNPPPSRNVEQIVEELIDQFGDENEQGDDASQGEGSRPPQSTAVAPGEQDLEDLLDQLGQASGDGEQDLEGEEGDGGSEGGGESPDDTGADGPATSPSDTPGERGIENPNPIGGTEGIGGPSEAGEERESGFIREQERARVGSDGEFVSEFVTEGVPIELVPGPEGSGVSFRVSYEQIASILRERGVPDGAIEIVRNYFNAITEGGP